VRSIGPNRYILPIFVTLLMAAMPAYAVIGFNLGAFLVNQGWLYGTYPALDLTGGDQTVAGGQILKYSTLNIPAGRTLTVSMTRADGLMSDLTPSAWSIIGVSGNATINGTILVRDGGAGSTYSAATPDGTILTYTLLQSSGGTGGSGYDGSGGYPAGGTPLFGNGGAGSSLSSANSIPTDIPTYLHGGSGDDTGYNNYPQGYAVVYGNRGPDGTGSSPYFNGDPWFYSGAGGGTRGRHGGLLYLMVQGKLSGTGIIDASGEAGGAGGNSALGTTHSGGGGGGGGAGGSGGKIMVRYHTNLTAPTLTYLIAPGAGGPPGSGVAISPTPGSSGVQGAVDVKPY
jgi:hypothetical protein